MEDKSILFSFLFFCTVVFAARLPCAGGAGRAAASTCLRRARSTTRRCGPLRSARCWTGRLRCSSAQAERGEPWWFLWPALQGKETHRWVSRGTSKTCIWIFQTVSRGFRQLETSVAVVHLCRCPAVFEVFPTSDSFLGLYSLQNRNGWSKWIHRVAEFKPYKVAAHSKTKAIKLLLDSFVFSHQMRKFRFLF